MFSREAYFLGNIAQGGKKFGGGDLLGNWQACHSCLYSFNSKSSIA